VLEVFSEEASELRGTDVEPVESRDRGQFMLIQFLLL
jgi:hypothetical protein